MRSPGAILELFVCGAGLAIAFLLSFGVVFQLNSDLIEPPYLYYYFIEEGQALLWVFLPGLMCILGLISEKAASFLFSPWENALKKSLQMQESSQEKKAKRTTAYYNQVRAYAFAGDKSASVANYYMFNRVKMRVAASWTLNAFLIVVQLIIMETTRETFDPFIFPWLTIGTFVLLGSVGAWYKCMSEEIQWLRNFNDSLIM